MMPCPARTSSPSCRSAMCPPLLNRRQHRQSVHRRFDRHLFYIALRIFHGHLGAIALDFEDAQFRRLRLALESGGVLQAASILLPPRPDSPYWSPPDSREPRRFCASPPGSLDIHLRALKLGFIRSARRGVVGLLSPDLLHQVVVFGLFIKDVLHLILAVKLSQNVTCADLGAVAHDFGDHHIAGHLAGKTRSLNTVVFHGTHRTAQTQNSTEIAALDGNGMVARRWIGRDRIRSPMTPDGCRRSAEDHESPPPSSAVQRYKAVLHR